MLEILEQLRRWAEVWPLLIPLSIFLIYRTGDKNLKAIFIYSLISFFLMLIATIQHQFAKELPSNLRNNNLFYNLHSIIRTLFFGWYIYQMKQVKQQIFLRYVFILYGLFILVYLFPYTKLLNFDVILFAAESIVLLIVSLTYFLSSIIDDEVEFSVKDPVFLVCTGISFYEAINFFINLFIFPLYDTNHDLGYIIMKISQCSFIIFCIFIGIAFYRSRGDKNDNILNVPLKVAEFSEENT
jgi:hypothetical protein